MTAVTEQGSSARTLHQEPTGQVRLVEYEPRFYEVMTRLFGARFIKYRQDWSDASEFRTRPHFPLSLDLEANASCNLACIMCVVGAASYQNPMAATPMMDMKLYERLMIQAQEHGLPAMTFGYLSEPLLRPDIDKMVRLARGAGVMDIRLGSNGMLLTSETSRQLVDAGLTRLEISLDAFRPETYRRIRRGGRLDRVVRNLEGFLDIRARVGSDIPVLRLSFLNLPHNRGEQEDFLEQWRLRADLFSIQEPIYYPDAPIAGQLKLVPRPVSPDFKCAQPWQRLIVRSNGDVYPCCSIDGLGLKIGSAGTSSIRELWNSRRMRQLAQLQAQGRFTENPHCLRCAEHSSCTAVRPGGNESETTDDR